MGALWDHLNVQAETSTFGLGHIYCFSFRLPLFTPLLSNQVPAAIKAYACPRCAICFRTMATPRFDAYLNSTLDRTALDWFYDKKTIKTSKAMEIILCLF